MEPITVELVTSNTITLHIKGGHFGLTKIPKTILGINKILNEHPGIDNLVIKYSHEIIPNLHSSPGIQEFDLINCKNISIHFGDLNIHSNLEHKFSKNIKFIPVEAFRQRHHDALTSWWSDQFVNELAYRRDFTYQCSKKYSSIIGRTKSHRIYIASELFRQGYFDKGYTNCTPQSNSMDAGASPNSNNNYLKGYFDCIDIQQRFEELQPHFQVADLSVFDRAKGGHMAHISSLNWFSDSYFNIVNETCFSNEWPFSELFITEKTYKPIVHQMPFIIAGSAGTLKYLRSMGFETFPEIFDESYDNELNSYKRIEMIIQQIKNACNTPDLHNNVYNIQDKLKRNRELFFKLK